MKNLGERKLAIFKIIDDYDSLLSRQKSEEYQKRREFLAANRKAIEEDRYQIAIIGFVKRGKSTLLNALLGSPENPIISPADMRVCTGAIVKYSGKALYPGGKGKEGAIVRYNDDKGGKSSEEIDLKDFPRYVSQTAPGYREELANKIEYVDVYGNFPFIENRGTFVDTPGLGAMHDQDYLAERMLPEADIILCPFAINNLLSANERGLLENSLANQKEKLVFLITKVDTVQEKELSDTAKEAEKIASELVGGHPPVYKVAAKRLVFANQGKEFDGKVEEPAVAKEASGIAALEEYLDTQLKKNSGTDARLRLFSNQLRGYIGTDEKNWSESLESLKLEADELEEKKKALEKAHEDLKKSFDKNVGKFKQNWKRVAERFIANLKAKEGEIVNRLSHKDKNLIALIGHSFTMERKVQSEMQSVITPVILDLQEKLEEITETFSKELQSDIDSNIVFTSPHFEKSSGLKNELSTLLGGGIAISSGAVGLTTALGAASAIGAAFHASNAAATAALAANGIAAQTAATAETLLNSPTGRIAGEGAASVVSGASLSIARHGLFPTIGATLFGGRRGRVGEASQTLAEVRNYTNDLTNEVAQNAREAAAEAAATGAAAVVARGALTAAIMSGFLPIIGGITVLIVGYKLGTYFANEKAAKAIPEIVSKQIEGAAKSIETQSKSMLDNFFADVTLRFDSILDKAKDDLDDTIKAIKSENKEARIQEESKNLEELGQIAKSLTALRNELY